MGLDLLDYLEIRDEETEVPVAEEQEQVSTRTMNTEVREFLELSAEAKRIKRRMEEIRDRARAYAKEHGEKTDKGHLEVLLKDGRIEYQNRRTVRLDEEKAVAFCKAKGLADCVRTVEVISEPIFESKLVDGAVTQEDLAQLVNVKENQALYIKEA
jgi:hypothetical protein